MDVFATGVTAIVGPSFRIGPSDVAFHLTSYVVVSQRADYIGNAASDYALRDVTIFVRDVTIFVQWRTHRAAE